ncbi:hypothetical protein F5146DRAFT_1001838 [Armillaria mellea]|nr:hypothetical protein F5146DRAFT_1001838 [Armillaria mellea]
MVDWNSSVELLKDADVFSKIIHLLLGIYMHATFHLLVVMATNRHVTAGNGSIPWILNMQLSLTLHDVWWTYWLFLGNITLGTTSINISIQITTIGGYPWVLNHNTLVGHQHQCDLG